MSIQGCNLHAFSFFRSHAVPSAVFLDIRLCPRCGERLPSAGRHLPRSPQSSQWNRGFVSVTHTLRGLHLVCNCLFLYFFFLAFLSAILLGFSFRAANNTKFEFLIFLGHALLTVVLFSTVQKAIIQINNIFYRNHSQLAPPPIGFPHSLTWLWPTIRASWMRNNTYS